MSKEGEHALYEKPIRRRLVDLLTASGGNISKSIEHRRVITKILNEGTAQELSAYFDSPAFEKSDKVRTQEQRYAAITALSYILFRDPARREKLLHALRYKEPSEAIASDFLIKDDATLTKLADASSRIAQDSGVSREHIMVLLDVLERTAQGSIDHRGKEQEPYKALRGIMYGGFSTMDNVIDAMYQCIDKQMIHFDSGFMSYSTEERRKVVRDILTVSFHRFQAVAGMKHDVSSSLLNSDLMSEWILLKRNDGQIVVTTKALETFLSEKKDSPIYNRLQKRHREGDPDLKHEQGCPIVILPLFLHAARAMIERYAEKVT